MKDESDLTDIPDPSASAAFLIICKQISFCFCLFLVECFDDLADRSFMYIIGLLSTLS